MSDSAQLLQRMSAAADEASGKSLFSLWQVLAGLSVLGVGFAIWRRRRDDNPWGTGKKMI